MNGWLAIVPIKPVAQRKQRLADALRQFERIALTERLLAHVVDVLQGAGMVDEVAVLAAERPAGWSGRLIPDRGRGLNAELDAAAGTRRRNLLVVHADLPYLSLADIEALVTVARAQGVAIAPDHLDTGTNAIGLSDVADFRFAFGPESLQRHLAIADGRAGIVRRPGLAQDIDLPDDLAHARAAGLLPLSA